jgi:hypothetical protein
MIILILLLSTHQILIQQIYECRYRCKSGTAGHAGRCRFNSASGYIAFSAEL